VPRSSTERRGVIEGWTTLRSSYHGGEAVLVQPIELKFDELLKLSVYQGFI
jgi:hypothetical protein